MKQKRFSAWRHGADVTRVTVKCRGKGRMGNGCFPDGKMICKNDRNKNCIIPKEARTKHEGNPNKIVFSTAWILLTRWREADAFTFIIPSAETTRKLRPLAERNGFASPFYNCSLVKIELEKTNDKCLRKMEWREGFISIS